MANGNGIPETIFGLLKIPATVIAFIVAIGIILAAMGFQVVTPGQSMEQHNTEVHSRIDEAISQLSANYEERTDLMRAIVRGYCIEHDQATLELAGLSQTCRNEGIEK